MTESAEITVLIVGNQTADPVVPHGKPDTFEHIETVHVAGISEATEYLDDFSIDCVVSAHKLPEGSGLDLLEIVRETNPGLPFVFYPEAGSERVAGAAVQAGVTEYLPNRSDTDQSELLGARIRSAVTETNSAETPVEGPVSDEQLGDELGDLAVEMLQAGEQDVDTQIQHALGRITTLVDADRSYICRTDPPDGTLRNTYTWSVSGGESQFEPLQDLQRHTISWWMQQLESFEPVIVPDVSELPPEATAETELLRERNVDSFLAVPLVRDDTVHGFIGFEWTESTAAWSDDLIEIVCSAGELLMSVLSREQRRRELERREAYLEQSSDIISVMSVDGTVQFQSESTERVTNFSPTEIIGQSGFEHVHPEDQKQITSQFGPFVAEPDAEITAELRVKAKDGDWRWIEVRGVNKMADPLIEGLVFSSRDITERKQREQELNSLKERLELAVEGADLGVWDWNMITDEVEFNEQWAEMLGYSLDEVEPHLGAWEDRMHPADRDAVESALESHISEQTDFYDTEHRMQTADGRWKWIRDIGRIVQWDEDGEPKRAVGIHLDIDERKQNEQKLEQARAKLRQIIDLIPDLIFAKNRDGEYLLANEATAQAYGVTPAEVEGAVESEIVPNEEDAEQFRADDLKVIESGEPQYITEETLTTTSGETLVLQTTKIPFEPPGSDEDAVLGYARDVTELKEYEDQLKTQRDNLEMLNQVVRHDIRNDLQLVLAYAERLQSQCEDIGDTDIKQVITAARDAAEITEVARDVTEVMLQPDAELHEVPLQEVLESEIEDFRSRYDAAVITIDDPIPAVSVLADDMLESVFRNLLHNALQHNDKDVPEITISGTVTDNQVVVQIADNGPGVPDERKAEIFGQGSMGLDSEGTGLGLYLVKTLVDRYGGAVSVKDNEPQGAVFCVELQVAE